MPLPTIRVESLTEGRESLPVVLSHHLFNLVRTGVRLFLPRLGHVPKKCRYLSMSPVCGTKAVYAMKFFHAITRFRFPLVNRSWVLPCPPAVLSQFQIDVSDRCSSAYTFLFPALSSHQSESLGTYIPMVSIIGPQAFQTSICNRRLRACGVVYSLWKRQR